MEIQKFLKKYKDLVIVFTISIILSAPYLTAICSGYLNYRSFDIQEFLMWNYSSISGFIPYKDIFYPYGILAYYRNNNLFFIVINYLISPFLLTILFFLFKKVFKINYFLYFSILVFYLFIVKVVGLDTFSRYGIFVIFSLLISYLFYINKIQFKLILYGIGFSLGLLISFYPDLGGYLIIYFFLMYFINILIKHDKKKSFGDIKTVFLGILIGVVPLVLFSIYQRDIFLFHRYFKEVNNIALTAKTPFFSFIDSPANIFTLSILFLSIFFIIYKCLYLKRKTSLSFYYQIALIIDILILEQKSIIRSIDQQITFIALILLMFIVYELISITFLNNVFKKVLYTASIFLVVVYYGSNTLSRDVDSREIIKTINLALTNQCFDNNMKLFLSKNPSYLKIINLLKNKIDFNNKIFSFPMGDSSFYILLDQDPPFYNSTIEGSSSLGQKLTIDHIKRNNINYILLNTDISYLIDGVPDFIRQSYLFRYILNNYHPYATVGKHIILKKNHSDFFASKILNESDYKNYLLKVYLYKIPYSEGLYKYIDLDKKSKLIAESYNTNGINKLLNEKNLSSNNKVIVVIPRFNYKPSHLNFIKIQEEAGQWTTIYFNSCQKNKPCLINLSRIPLFYKDRVIKKISLDNTFKGQIKVYEIKQLGMLW